MRLKGLSEKDIVFSPGMRVIGPEKTGYARFIIIGLSRKDGVKLRNLHTLEIVELTDKDLLKNFAPDEPLKNEVSEITPPVTPKIAFDAAKKGIELTTSWTKRAADKTLSVLN